MKIGMRKQHVRLSPLAGICLLLLAKLALLRVFLFGEITGLGLLSDALSLLAMMSLLELVLPRRGKRGVYWAINAVFSLMLFAAVLYRIHFNTVPTYTALGGLGQVPQIRGSITVLIQPYHFLFFADMAIALAIGAVRLFNRASARELAATLGERQRPLRTGTLRGKIAAALVLVASAAVSLQFIAEGSRIDNELVQAERLGFLNYQVASAIKNKRENDLIARGNLQDTIRRVNELQATYPYRKEDKKDAKPAHFGEAKGMNVIVVQMEAFQNFPIHLKLGGQEVTPVLNRLAKEGYYFPHVYQQIGQGNTSDAEFISNTSIYPTGTVAMSTGFGDRELPSLPRLLNKLHYQSATFHVNEVQFWSRHLLYPGVGFDRYFDQPYYENDHFNDFGASDEELYRVGGEKLTEMGAAGQPFYAQFVTASSHAPFVIPPDRRRLKLPPEMENTQLGHYLTAIHYTDYALGRFIDQLKADGIWDNTVLVAYGDHSGVNPAETDGKEIAAQLGIPYDNKVSRFNIPLIIHVPGQKSGKTVELTGGQVDIMPTLANLLGISLKEQQFTAFGRDLLNTDHNVIGMRYYLPTGSFFTNEILFVPGTGFEDGEAISLRTLEPVLDLEPYRRDYEYILSLMKLSDEYVQLLPKR
ncbi:MAG: LTA synthase family protein [Paenibacillus dendritiformis]|uniref:LTA synthase family protein n=1 Tax=uncultured Paenibacillus sp. TaxID=227322 RepID=UPI0025D3F07B|nr:LTA synthase family protein [uncultured Paenibacillus sp.]MDU5145605.1 LTA synthase family protein [Paenibacillus dendritiformis]